MLTFLTTGLLLGMAAGLAPGPVLALVISETLTHGIRSGIKVALAPLVTDLPLIIATVFILARLTQFNQILGMISLTGGYFVGYLGYESIRCQGLSPDAERQAPRSLAKGVLTNLLSPYPYLFWFSVGAPTIVKALQIDRSCALAFIGAFYCSLVGAKIALALAVETSRTFLTGKMYIYSSRLIGGVLCILALGLFRDGLRLLGFELI